MTTEPVADPTTAAPERADAAEQWRGAVDRYRDAAKWVIAGYAAIGVLLAGTAPLAGIGGVDSSRLPALLWGGLLGLLGVGLAIVATVSMLVPRSVYWHEIKAKSQNWWGKTFLGLGPLEDVLAKDPRSVLPPGVTSLAGLDTGIANLQVLLADSRAAAEAAATDAAKARAAADVADKEDALDQYLDAREELMLIGRFEKARTGFRIALVVVTLGSLLAGAGLGLLLYGVSDDSAHQKTQAEISKLKAEADQTAAEAEKAKADAAKTRAETTGATGSQAPDTPVEGEPVLIYLSFTKAGTEAVLATLGSTCDVRRVAAEAMAGNSGTGTWDVITVRTSACAAVRLTVTPAIARVVP